MAVAETLSLIYYKNRAWRRWPEEELFKEFLKN